jgi:hypothetical protein
METKGFDRMTLLDTYRLRLAQGTIEPDAECRATSHSAPDAYRAMYQAWRREEFGVRAERAFAAEFPEMPAQQRHQLAVLVGIDGCWIDRGF